MFHRFKTAAVLATLGASVAAPALALERYVRIYNNTSYTMTEFYGSNKGTDSWEEDIFGNQVLPAGASVDVNFDDGSGYCVFDFKAVFSNGAELTDYDLNICELDNFYYNN